MPFLDDAIKQVQTAIEHKFLFRKIGLPFDYASKPDDFPSKAFATAKEARGNIPNQSGLGGGYAFSCRNHSLLFDGYLLRMELGIEAPGDEAILDRLIGGLIRLDTVAPKSFLVGGLAPDGRGFYAMPFRANHAAWLYAVHRGLGTAAIAPESQEKFRSIAGKWIDRVRREKFKLHTVDNKPVADGDFSAPDHVDGPLLLAMQLTAAIASNNDKDFEAYATLADENNRARLAAGPAYTERATMPELALRQYCLSVIAASDPDAERAALAKTRMAEYAAQAGGFIRLWHEWDDSLVETEVDLNWRNCEKASVDVSPFGFVPPPSWERMAKEQPLAEAMSAMLAVLLAGDSELAKQYQDDMAECLSTVPWDGIMTLNALAPALTVHARGVEMGLWDVDLFESRREPPSSEISFAAKYLEPDYDEENPGKAGHSSPPPGKAGQKSGDAPHKRRRRRRRR